MTAHHHLDHLLNHLKESIEIMTQILDDANAVLAAAQTFKDADAAKDAKILDLKSQLSTATTSLTQAQTDLATASAQVADLPAAQAAVEQATTLLTPPAPPVPVPAVAFFTFVGDPTTIDTTQWGIATVHGANGEVLYTHLTADAFDAAVWVAYTGVAA